MPYFMVRGPTPLAPAYTGPGDVVSGVLAWWGLRAYSAAKAAALTPLIDIVKASDGSAPMTINSLSNGNLDVATIAGLGYAVKVSKIYDQVGTNHLEQATLAIMPDLTLNLVGSLPGMTFAISTIQTLTKVGFLNQAQPVSLSWVARRTGIDFTNGMVVTSNTDANIFGGYFNDTSSMMAAAGNFVTAGTTVNNSLNAVHIIFNGASSEFVANGAAGTTVDSGLTGLNASNAINIGNITTNGNSGDICEVGWWSGAFSAGDKTALADNEMDYWGI
jgi:hypothetical protein